jgi:pyruvate ferredoxin oxidoreductase gamma subunit
MESIRIHGRGGQGVVTAAELIAIAGFYEGRESQAFPSFGVERSGAPIQSFARIDDRPIITREQVYEPSILIIQDASLIDSVDVFSGCKKDTAVIINSPKKDWPEIKKRFPKTFLTPASEIAIRILGKNLANTVILGALAKKTAVVSLESLKKAIKEKFASKGAAIIEKNIKAIEEAYNL